MEPECNLTEEYVRSVMREFIIGKIRHALNDDDNYFETGFVDSMFGMQLIAFIESQFEFDVGDDDLAIDNFNSVANVVRFIVAKLVTNVATAV